MTVAEKTTAPPKHDRPAIYPCIAALAIVAFVLRLACCVNKFSPATDEPSHIGAAVSMIEAHKLIAPGSHPPLARLVAAIPLWLDGARLPECRGQTTIGTEDLGYRLGTEVLYGSIPFMTLLVHARLAMLVFPVIALVYVYLLGRHLAGPAPAAAAVVFFSLDPTLLGHGFWIGNDVAGCAGYLAATYHGLRWLQSPTWKYAIFAGLAAGLAVSTKFSCVLAFPALGLIACFVKPAWKRLLVQLPAIVLIGFVTLWATYFFNVGPLSDQAGLKASADQTATGNTPENAPAKAMRQQWQRIPAFIRDTPIPMPSCFLAIARLMFHNRFGHLVYLNGQTSTTGWWYYFPEVFVLKSPLGFLAALFVAACLFIATRDLSRATVAAILIPPAVFVASAMTAKLDIGVRYILPALPFLYLFIAIELCRPGFVWLLAGLMLVAAIETAAVHPDYMAYFNLAAGGPSNGDRFALDNNLDWNQDLLRMADWIRQNDDGRPYAIRLAAQRNRPLLVKLGLDGNALDAPPHGHLLFISKNARLMDGVLPWLANHRPIARIGYSIDVYDLTGPAAPDEPDDVPARDDPAQSPGQASP